MGNRPDFKWWDGGGGMLDQIICSCGWESRTYFDGREYAYDEWKKHVKKSHADEDAPVTDRLFDTGEKKDVENG
jgi:hypothetical protein